jgi:hypothetical protein
MAAADTECVFFYGRRFIPKDHKDGAGPEQCLGGKPQSPLKKKCKGFPPSK